MKSGNSKKIIATLVFAAIFSTVAPAEVFSFDTEMIINVVQSKSSSNGQSGIDGEDGVDGKPGQDGRGASNGGSVVNISNTASLYSETVANGEKIINVLQTRTTKENGGIVVAESVTTSTRTEILDELPASVNEALTDDEVYSIQKVLTSIRLMLQTYVGILF